MKKILVPTDLSRHSRPGMRFAIHWSRLQKTKLLFVHVLHIARLTSWSDEQYEAFANSEREYYLRKLKNVVADVHKRMGIDNGNYECRILEGVITEPTLLDFCRQHTDIDLICMSTDGARGLQQLFGTHAGNILANSSIPVVVVPKGYRVKPVTRVLYATDLHDYEEELRKVAAIAAAFKASLDVLHLIRTDEPVPNKGIFEKVLAEEVHYPVHILFPFMDETHSMAVNLQQQIRLLKPSLTILFTNQDRTVLQKVLYPSRTERIAFRTSVPLMVFARRPQPAQQL